jgi:hypothetical protein
MTDNTITYNLLFTDPLFAVLGAAIGVFAAERRMALSLTPADALWSVDASRQRAKLKPTPGQPPFPPGRGIILPNQ